MWGVSECHVPALGSVSLTQCESCKLSERAVFVKGLCALLDGWMGLGGEGEAYHLTVPRPPKIGFCLSLGFARWAARDGADGPMSAYSSLGIPSGFFEEEG